MGKVLYGPEPSVENLLPPFVGSIISYVCSNATEVAQLAAPSCNRRQPAARMTSETVDPIDWSLPTIQFMGQYPLIASLQRS